MKRMIYLALGIVFFSFCFIAYAQLGQGEPEKEPIKTVQNTHSFIDPDKYANTFNVSFTDSMRATANDGKPYSVNLIPFGQKLSDNSKVSYAMTKDNLPITKLEQKRYKYNITIPALPTLSNRLNYVGFYFNYTKGLEVKLNNYDSNMSKIHMISFCSIDSCIEYDFSDVPFNYMLNETEIKIDVSGLNSLRVDPTVTFSTGDVTAITITPLSNDTFAIIFCDTATDDVNLIIYNTSGTNMTSSIKVDDVANCVDNYVISATAFDSNTFAVAWDDGTSPVLKIYNSLGNNLTTEIDAGSAAGGWVSISAFNSTYLAYGWMDYGTQDVTFSVYDRTGTKICGATDADTNAGAYGGQVSVSAMSSEQFVIAWIDTPTTNRTTFRFYDSACTNLTSAQTVVDASLEVSEQYISVSAFNSSHIFLAWANNRINTLNFSIYAWTTKIITGSINSIALVSTAVFNSTLAIAQDNYNDYVVSTYLSNGTEILDKVFIGDEADAIMYAQAIAAYNPATNIGFCNNSFISAWVWSKIGYAEQANWSSYHSDGTAWDGVCPSEEPENDDYTVSLSDTIIISESTGIGKTLSKLISDIITATDSIAKKISKIISLSDAFIISDNIETTEGKIKTVFSIFSITESIGIATTYKKSKEDTLTFSESISISSNISTGNIEISSCGNLTEAGKTYILTEDIIDNIDDVCLWLQNSNITLDCQGYSITQNSTSWAGITAYDPTETFTLTNLTVKNCKVYDYDAENNNGIDFEITNNSYIYNNTIENSYYALGFYEAFNNTIEYNIIKDAKYAVYYNSANNHFFNNYFLVDNFTSEGSGWGTNYWNTTQQAGTRVYSNGTETGGNFWDEYTYLTAVEDGWTVDNLTLPEGCGVNDDILVIGAHEQGTIYEYSLVKFNIEGLQENEYEFCLYVSWNNYGDDDEASAYLYEIDNQTWEECDNVTLATIGTGDLITQVDDIKTYQPDTKPKLCFNVTDYINEQIGLGTKNVSLFMNSTIIVGEDDEEIAFHSKDTDVPTNQMPSLKYLSTSAGYSKTCADDDQDGFCDEPYEIAENNTDYLPLSNKYTANKTYSISLSDTITLTDSINRKTTSARYLSDTITFSDSISYSAVRHYSSSLSDTITFAESINYTYVYQPKQYTKNLTDSILLSDNILANKGISKALQDNMVFSDIITASSVMSYSRSVSDAMTATDTISRKINITFPLRDALIFSESIGKTSLMSYSADVSDAMIFADNIKRNTALSVSKSESLLFSESISISSVFAYSRSVSDAMAFSELIGTSTFHAYSRSVLDSMTISDIITASTMRNATIILYDALTFSDKITIALTITEKLRDTIIIYDNAKAVYASLVQIIINLIGQTTNSLTFNWSIYTGTNATGIWLVENETNTLIKTLPSPLNETWNYTFDELSRYRQYTIYINATDGTANYTEYLDAMTLMESGVFSKWLFIGFMSLLIILLYFYFFHDVIYFGVLAGVIMIFIAIVLGATGYLSDLSCVDNNIRETVSGAITSHDYHIICQESILDMDRSFINALSLILLVIGSFIIVDFSYTIKRGKANA
jgi:hypothetical protein